MTKKYNIEVDCAACAAKAEKAISGVPGVESVSINFVTQKMSLEANESLFPGIVKECLKAAKKAEPDFEIEF